jgi:hypothetical protein
MIDFSTFENLRCHFAAARGSNFITGKATVVESFIACKLFATSHFGL